MNPIIKPNNKSKHILMRIWLLNGLTQEIKMVGINDPRIAVWQEACGQGLVAAYEIVEVTCSNRVIATTRN
jgi:hypothetical protein